MPVCTYTIRKDEIDGPILRYARVGEQVVHRWECQTGECRRGATRTHVCADVYGMLVPSCFVEDGQGPTNGCCRRQRVSVRVRVRAHAHVQLSR